MIETKKFVELKYLLTLFLERKVSIRVTENKTYFYGFRCYHRIEEGVAIINSFTTSIRGLQPKNLQWLSS